MWEKSVQNCKQWNILFLNLEIARIDLELFLDKHPDFPVARCATVGCNLASDCYFCEFHHNKAHDRHKWIHRINLIESHVDSIGVQNCLLLMHLRCVHIYRLFYWPFIINEANEWMQLALRRCVLVLVLVYVNGLEQRQWDNLYHMLCVLFFLPIFSSFSCYYFIPFLCLFGQWALNYWLI